MKETQELRGKKAEQNPPSLGASDSCSCAAPGGRCAECFWCLVAASWKPAFRSWQANAARGSAMDLDATDHRSQRKKRWVFLSRQAVWISCSLRTLGTSGWWGAPDYVCLPAGFQDSNISLVSGKDLCLALISLSWVRRRGKGWGWWPWGDPWRGFPGPVPTYIGFNQLNQQK